jgi:hypothetical protein
MENKEEGNEPTKFNMGLATLEEISDLLKYYHRISIMDSIEIGGKSFKITDTLECQTLKSRICNQLLIASRPLLKDDQKEKLSDELKKTKLFLKDVTQGRGPLRMMEPRWSYIVDKACDDYISLLVDLLQINKVFMPGKGEHNLF